MSSLLRKQCMLAALAAFGQGCGEIPAEAPIFRVSGTIFADGKAPVGAEVVFHPVKKAADGNPTTAIVQPDGSFKPSTRKRHDGAPAGDYLLTVVWRKMKIVEGEEVLGADRFSGKYSDPHSSGLKASIKDGENVLPVIELSTPR